MAKEETRKKKPVPTVERDELAEVIAASLNKLNKNSGQVAFFLDGEDETPLDITDFISTGNTMLDLAISNRPHGGIAVGRITELTGLEASGKSLLGASIIVSTQKRGGTTVLIDTENAANEEFLSALGVDLKKLLIVPLTTVESVFDNIVDIIEKVRSSDKKDKLVTIIVDSVAGASTEVEMETDFAKQGYATGKAIIISAAMRKIVNLIGKQKIALIFTNQLRHKMNAPAFSDPYTTSGGKAIGFAASTRIRLSQIGKIKDSNGIIIGVKVKAVITKSRLGPPYREAVMDVYFNRGIDDYSGQLTALKDIGVIKQAGAWYSYEGDKFQAKEFPKFLDSDPVRKELLYNQICESFIMKYENQFDPASVTVDETFSDD